MNSSELIPTAAAPTRLGNLLIWAASVASLQPSAGGLAAAFVDEARRRHGDLSGYERYAAGMRLASPFERFLVSENEKPSESLARFLAILASIREVRESIWREAMDALTACQVTAICLKGSDIGVTCFPEGFVRHALDLDVLVAPLDLPLAEMALANAGFITGRYDMNTFAVTPHADGVRDAALREHYEIPPYYRIIEMPELASDAVFIREWFEEDPGVHVLGSKVYVTAEVDVHFNIALGWDVRDVWDDLRRFTDRDQERWGLSAEILLLLLAFRAYNESTPRGHKRVRSHVDLFACLLTMSRRVDWAKLGGFAMKYQLAPALYYTIRPLAEIHSDLVPEDFLLQMRGECVRDHRLNGGDYLGRLFGLAQALNPFDLPMICAGYEAPSGQRTN